jgi:hypothetical protein
VVRDGLRVLRTIVRERLVPARAAAVPVPEAVDELDVEVVDVRAASLRPGMPR